jgi:hypothetical protein
VHNTPCVCVVSCRCVKRFGGRLLLIGVSSVSWSVLGVFLAVYTCRVKLGTHAQTGEQYALKFLRKESSAAAASVFKQVGVGSSF